MPSVFNLNNKSNFYMRKNHNNKLKYRKTPIPQNYYDNVDQSINPKINHIELNNLHQQMYTGKSPFRRKDQGSFINSSFSKKPQIISNIQKNYIDIREKGNNPLTDKSHNLDLKIKNLRTSSLISVLEGKKNQHENSISKSNYDTNKIFKSVERQTKYLDKMDKKDFNSKSQIYNSIENIEVIPSQKLSKNKKTKVFIPKYPIKPVNDKNCKFQLKSLFDPSDLKPDLKKIIKKSDPCIISQIIKKNNMKTIEDVENSFNEENKEKRPSWVQKHIDRLFNKNVITNKF